MLASTVINEVRRILVDAAGNAYSPADLMSFLNEALVATAGAKNDLYVKRELVGLDDGVEQHLPDDGIVLINITRNGSGKVCTQCDFGLLQEANRFWPEDAAETEIENWAYNPKDPRRYYVTPPIVGVYSEVMMTYGAVPAAVSDLGEELPVLDIYRPTLVNFMLSRSYAISSKRYDPTKEQFYLQQWGTSLGLKSQSTVAVAAKVSESPGK